MIFFPKNPVDDDLITFGVVEDHVVASPSVISDKAGKTEKAVGIIFHEFVGTYERSTIVIMKPRKRGLAGGNGQTVNSSKKTGDESITFLLGCCKRSNAGNVFDGKRRKLFPAGVGGDEKAMWKCSFTFSKETGSP